MTWRERRRWRRTIYRLIVLYRRQKRRYPDRGDQMLLRMESWIKKYARGDRSEVQMLHISKAVNSMRRQNDGEI